MAAFVVDMAKVFEDFVGTALTEALRRYPGGTRLQYPSHLDCPGRRAARDLHARRHRALRAGPSALVFDAKYKAASPTGTYPNADHYQMLAYCTALQVPTAWLVYANGPQGRRRIVNSDVTVMEHSLDLSTGPADLLAQVDALAATAWDEATARAVRATRLRPA